MGPGDAEAVMRALAPPGVRGVWILGRFPALFDPHAVCDSQAAPRRPSRRKTDFVPLMFEHYRLERLSIRPRG
jgi:hypothetical protein